MRFALALLAVLAVSHAAPTPISSTLRAAFQEKGQVDIMIVLKEETRQVRSRINTQSFANSDEKTISLYQQLKQFTADSQKDILSFLSTRRSSGVQGFYITNRISVKAATADLVEEILARKDLVAQISEIREAKVLHIGDVTEVGKDERDAKVLEWGVGQINAPEVWERGFTGAGVIVSNIDTGVRYTHNALQGAYLDNGFSWLDPYQGSTTPNDQQGHGSHTMGSICGRNGTGVAPGAKFISCRGCGTTECTEDALISCGQFTMCPTSPDGSQTDCSKKPHVSSNSWGGGNEDPFYNDIIESWVDANIIPVFSIGNAGPGCRSANSPGDQPNLISVGATNNMDVVATFSSHGPSFTALRLKPEVSAPGVNIRSCGISSDTAYSILSGTSMAAPHVAGAVAVLLESGVKGLKAIADALQDNAVRPNIDTIVCSSGVNATYPWPNNSFGHGRIDLNASVKAFRN